MNRSKPVLANVCLVLVGLLWSGVAAANDEESNKEAVVAFYEMTFQDHKPAEAAQRYIGDEYIQHNPHLPDGAEPFVNFFEGFFEKNPEAHNEIKRVIAEDDLVVLHVHSKANPEDRGRAVVDIFRLEDGRIVEHWDVAQPVPESSANDNTLF